MYEDFFLDHPVISIVGIVIVVLLPVFIFGYFSSCKKAEVFNKVNNTAYTCSDFFWAGNQINSQTQTIKLK